MSTTGHPITDPDPEAQAWQWPAGHAWMASQDPHGLYPDGDGPFVIVVGASGEAVTVPRTSLVALATALLAAHVDAARTDRWPR